MSVDYYRSKLKEAYYKRPCPYIIIDEETETKADNPDVITLEERINELILIIKQKEKYKNCTDDELLTIAYYIISSNNLDVVTTRWEGYIKNTGKPVDPIWSQFTYDEILGMADDGVCVPQEFLDWANSMADGDTTSYEIESDSSEDPNTASNLSSETDDKTKLGQQKKLQKFSSKAEQQEELLEDKNTQLQQQEQDLQSIQNDLEKDQKLTLDTIDKITQEFDTLNSKVQSGVALTDEEIRRYKQLGVMLNTQGQELIAQSKNVEEDLQELLTQMDNVDSIVNVNKEISGTLESLSLEYAETEGGKKHTYIAGATGINTFGAMEAYAYSAQGLAIASSAGVIGIKLDIDSDKIQTKLNTNASIAKITMDQVAELKAEALNINPAVSRTENYIQTPDENENESTTETKTIPDSNINENSQNTSNNQTISGSTTVNESMEDTNQDESVQSVQALTTGETTGGAAPATDNVQSLDEEPAIDETSNTEQNQAVSEDEPTDPLEAAAREYLEGCGIRASELQTATDTIFDLRSEVKNIRKSRFKDTIKTTAEFKKTIEIYQELLNKVKNAGEFTQADQIEFERLNSILDGETGSIATDMQSKIEILDKFSGAVEMLQTKSQENIEYGNAAITAGKEYALQDQSGQDIKLLMPLFANTDKLYDKIYGKSGESLGRDVIDNGINLIKQSKFALRTLIFTRKLGEFASEYSAKLNYAMSKNNADVSSITQEFQAYLPEELKEANTANAPATAEAETTSDSTTTTDETATAEAETTSDNTTTTENTVENESTEKTETESVEADSNLTDSTTESEPVDPLEANAKEHMEGCETRSEEVSNAVNTIMNLRSEVKDIRKSRLRDSIKAAVRFETAFDQYEKLLDKVKNDETFSEADQARYQRLNSILDGDNGSIATDIQDKISVLDEFSNAVNTVEIKSKENLEYGKETVEAGVAYANQELSGKKLKHKFIISSRNKLYDFLYGKSGESLARDTIDSGEELSKSSKNSRRSIIFTSKKLGNFSSDYSAKLNQVMNDNNAKVSPLTREFQQLLGDTTTDTQIHANENSQENETNTTINNETEETKEEIKTGAEGVSAEIVNNISTKTTDNTIEDAVKDAEATVLTEAENETLKADKSELTADIGEDIVSDTFVDDTMEITPPLLSKFYPSSSNDIITQSTTQSVEESQQLAVNAVEEAVKNNTNSQIKDIAIEAGKQVLLNIGEKTQQRETIKDKKQKILVQFERKKRDAIKRGVEQIRKASKGR